jgi:hypothetical protein
MTETAGRDDLNGPVTRKGRSGRRLDERLEFMSLEQLSEKTGRPLADVRAEAEAVSRAQADERIRRCEALVLRPHEGVDVPVETLGLGFPLDGHLEAQNLARLGVSARLIERLRSWQQGWENGIENPAAQVEFLPGQPLSIRLARQLQSELPAIAISLDVSGDLRRADDLSP